MNLIYTTLKMIFSILIFFLPPLDSRFSNIVQTINGNIIFSAFRWCINLNFQELTLMTGFVLQGHILYKFDAFWKYFVHAK